MAIPKITRKELSLVVIGSFNPAIISPAWLGSNSLLRESEVDDPNVEIINNDLSIFKAGWLDVAIDHKRLQFKTSLEAVFDSLKDLTISVLTILIHTPVTQLGINHHFSFQLKSKEERNELGFKLVPKNNWTRFCDYEGMAALEIHANRQDKYKGKVKVYITPDFSKSTVFKLSVNDHYEFSASEKNQGIENLIEVLSENWKYSREQTNKILEGLFE